VSNAEQSQPSELGLADTAARFASLMDGSPQPEKKARAEVPAAVEETEATDELSYDAQPLEGEATDEVSDEGGEDSNSGSDEEASSEDLPDDALVTVVIDGKAQRVTLKEARDGYQRQADYQRKTQALAEQRREVETLRQATEGEKSAYAEAVGALRAEMEKYLPQEPDWQRLHQEDPINFPIIEKQWRDYKAQLAAVQQQEAVIKAQQAREQQEQLRQIVEEGRKYIFEKVPEWKDEAKWSQAQKALREYGKVVGYSDDELAAATDPRAIIVLEKARKYDALQANRPQPSKGTAPKPMRAGNLASSPRQATDVAKVKQRLKSTGHVNDAAAIFAMLDRK
jgi:hypothetical protein